MSPGPLSPHCCVLCPDKSRIIRRNPDLSLRKGKGRKGKERNLPPLRSPQSVPLASPLRRSRLNGGRSLSPKTSSLPPSFSLGQPSNGRTLTRRTEPLHS